MREGVAVWSIDELITIYRYGTDRERLLLLLALNCGFTQAEICGLRLDEVVKAAGTTSIRRVRHNSQVYGEFVLWPETVAAIGWFRRWLRGKPRTTEVGEHLMISGRGSLYDRISIANSWNDLLDRIQMDHPAFRRLSFKAMRKTGGQLVRERADGEITGVFLCHGKAVVTDVLADVYTNRPFGKVAAALSLVHRDLKPVFDAAAEAFSDKPGRSPNISRAIIDKIQQLGRASVDAREVANQTGTSLDTVYRWLGRRRAVQEPE